MTRFDEIMKNLKAFDKEKYHSSELLPELLALQQEMVQLTFNDEHVSTGNLRIWDVEKHLKQLNANCGDIATEELQRFIEEGKEYTNMICAEISGQRGEARAFSALQYLRTRNIILRNVEIIDGNNRTEIDAIVITPNALTIVEVKNTAKNIFIDENGDYYRTGEYLRWDSNIAEKMTLRERLIKELLMRHGIQNVQIRSLVTFTNNRIEVHNRYSGLTTCFVNQLSGMIENAQNDKPMSEEKMTSIEKAIKASACKEAYPVKFNVAQYKKDFATVMAKLEEASKQREETVLRDSCVTKEHNNHSFFRTILQSKYIRFAGKAAAAFALSTTVINMIKKVVR